MIKGREKTKGYYIPEEIDFELKELNIDVQKNRKTGVAVVLHD